MTGSKAAIVGAGISGASCAGMLAAAGVQVDVFDMARSAGGRLSARHLDSGWASLGAPFVSAWDPPFRAQLKIWSDQGWLVPLAGRMLRGRADKGWTNADLRDHYLPVIETSMLVRDLLGSAKLHTDSEVTAVKPHGVVLEDGREPDGYDYVVCSVPSPQAISLLDTLPQLQEDLTGVRYRPIWSFLMRWAGGPDADVLKLDDSRLDLVVRQQSAGPDLWVLHSSHEFAETHAGSSEIAAATQATTILKGLLGLSQDVECKASKHWKFARAVVPVGGYWLGDHDSHVALIGDGITGAGIERAWESGMRLAQAILTSKF